MRISVTAKDIAEGRQRYDRGDGFRCENCPVALAISRAVSPVAPQSVMVGAVQAILYNNASNKTLWDVELPNVARDFIYAFDGRKPVAPFDFDLEIPA